MIERLLVASPRLKLSKDSWKVPENGAVGLICAFAAPVRHAARKIYVTLPFIIKLPGFL